MGSYHVEEGNTLILVRGSRPEANSNAASAASVPTPQVQPAVNQSAPVVPPPVNNANPFAAMMGNMGNVGLGAPNMQQMLQNPEMMQQIMKYICEELFFFNL